MNVVFAQFQEDSFNLAILNMLAFFDFLLVKMNELKWLAYEEPSQV